LKRLLLVGETFANPHSWSFLLYISSDERAATELERHREKERVFPMCILSPCLSLSPSLCVSLTLRQMAIFFEKFLHNVGKSPVRIKLRVSFQALFELAIGPSSRPREEMR
jgi:hypothetical protein